MARRGTVFCVHGFGGSPAAFEAVSAPEGFEKVAVPLFGHGADDPSIQTFDDEARRLLAICRATPGPRVLCGYSLGGRLSLRLAVLDPSIASAAVIVGANPGIAEQEREPRARKDDEWAALIETVGVARFFERWVAQPLFATQQGLPPSVLEKQVSERAALTAGPLARAMRVLSVARMPDMRDDLGSMPPVLYAAGALDPGYAEAGRRLAERYPGFQVRIADGAGHNLLLEAPEFVGAVLAEAARIASTKE